MSTRHGFYACEPAASIANVTRGRETLQPWRNYEMYASSERFRYFSPWCFVVWVDLALYLYWYSCWCLVCVGGSASHRFLSFENSGRGLTIRKRHRQERTRQYRSVYVTFRTEEKVIRSMNREILMNNPNHCWVWESCVRVWITDLICLFSLLPWLYLYLSEVRLVQQQWQLAAQWMGVN
jgi:hypothetical protein